MEINKVVFGSDTIMDISDTTASDGDVLANKYFYTAAGVRTAGIAQALTIDSALSTTSENPVQNKVITQKVGLDSLNTVAQDLSGAVNEILGAIPSTAADIGAYALPTTGIPSSDLADTYAGSPTAGGIANKTASIPMGKLDAASTSTVMTATIDGITELRDGVCVWLTNGVVTSASGYTININGLGAKPVYSSQAAATRTTSLFNSGYTALLIYNSTRVEGGCWDYVYGYDSNTNTIGYQLRTNCYSLPMTSIVYRYRLLFQSADNAHWVPANNSTSTNATASRTVCQDKINPFGSIVYYGTTASVAAGSRPSVANLWQQYGFTFGYSFNRTGAALTLTSWKPIYIKCALQSDGSAIIDSTTPYVQDLPTTEDGKIYIFLGVAYSATAVELTLNHPVYWYKDGRIRLYTDASYPVTSVNGQTGDVSITIPSQASDVGAIPAPANPSTGNVLTYRNNAWVSEAPAAVPSLSNDSPAALQAQAAAGSSLKVSRADHVHPLPTPISVTYSELRTKITNEALVPGQFYRITDFVTTVKGTYDLTDVLGSGYLHYARSAGNQFDLIVQAIDEFSLDDKATAANHENSGYWVSGIDAWDIRYSVYNDTDNYAWADPNGKGVIYYLKDEFGNEAWYDFKNVQFLGYGIEKIDENYDVVSSTLNYDSSTTDVDLGFEQTNRYGTPYNLLMLVDPSAESDKIYLNYRFTCGDTISSALELSEVDSTYLTNFNAEWYYTFDVRNEHGHSDLSLNLYQNVCCYNNSISPCRDFYQEWYNQQMSNNGQNTLGLGGNIFQNVDPDGVGFIDGKELTCHDNHIESNSHFNIFGSFSSNNYINDCNGNAFGHFAYENTLQDFSRLNTCEDNGRNNIFSSSSYNEFGTECKNNQIINSGHTIFAYYCGYNKLVSCSSNSFGEYSYYNTLQSANSNSFGASNIGNIIGTSFSDSIFGDGCSYNTIGSYNSGFTLGNYCKYFNVGNGNYQITTGPVCQGVTIGNNNRYLTIPNYMDSLIVDNDTYSVTLTGDTNNYKWCFGGHVYSNVEEYTGAVNRNIYYSVSIGRPTTGAVRSWNIHDAYVKPSAGIPSSDMAAAVQSALAKADSALQSAPVTSVNGSTGAVVLTIPSSASDIGAIPAPASPASGQVLVYENGAWENTEPGYIVDSLSPNNFLITENNGTYHIAASPTDIYNALTRSRPVYFYMANGQALEYTTITQADLSIGNFVLDAWSNYSHITLTFSPDGNGEYDGVLHVYTLDPSGKIDAPASASTGNVLKYNGSTWVAAEEAATGISIVTPSAGADNITLNPYPVTYDFGERSALTVTVSSDTAYHFGFSCPSSAATVLNINGTTRITGDSPHAGGLYEVDIWAGGALVMEVGVDKISAPASASDGQYLQYSSATGAWVAADIQAELPAVTSSDNGKVLRVVDGAWAAASLLNANGVSF